MKGLATVVLLAAVVVCWSQPAAAQDGGDPHKIQQRLEALEKLNLDRGAQGEEHEDPEHGSKDEGMKGIPFKLSGEMRVREEIWNHFYGPGINTRGRDSFDFAHMRTRLRFDMEVENDLDVVIELQDVRTLGAEGSTTADTEGVDLKRSEFILSNLFCSDLKLEVGRFVMAYGDERIIGALEWVDQGRTYDGFRFCYAPDGWFADFFGVRVNDLAVSDMDDQDLVGVYAGHDDLCPVMGLEGYALLFRDQVRQIAIPLSDTERRFVTLGVRAFGEQDRFDYTGELAIQEGDAGGDDLRAYAFALNGGMAVSDCPWEPRVYGEIAYASGDKRPTDNDNEQFQHMFPTNHRHYGYADLVAWSNIWDLRVGASVEPCTDVTASVDLHRFVLADDDGGWINAAGDIIRPGPGAKASRHLGEEIDLTVGWKTSDHLALETGYRHFFPGGFVEDTGDDRDLDVIYVQARITF